MAITDRKITAFDKLVAELDDKPNANQGISAQAVKEWIDSSPEELRVALNGLIDDLVTDYATKADLEGVTAGSIPDFSLYPQKMAKLNTYASGLDANGIYTVVQEKRTDGTLAIKSTLSNQNASGYYQTQTVQVYATNGTTVLYTVVYTITWDSNGKIISKVVNA